jgi:hypothetical protein
VCKGGANEAISHFQNWLECQESGGGCGRCAEHGGPRCTS